MIRVFVFYEGLSVPWGLRAVNDLMSWSMFLADSAVIAWTVWFLMRTAVAREAGWFFDSDWFRGDEQAWLLPSEITLIALVYSSFKLIQAPAIIITLFWPLL